MADWFALGFAETKHWHHAATTTTAHPHLSCLPDEFCYLPQHFKRELALCIAVKDSSAKSFDCMREACLRSLSRFKTGSLARVVDAPLLDAHWKSNCRKWDNSAGTLLLARSSKPHQSRQVSELTLASSNVVDHCDISFDTSLFPRLGASKLRMNDYSSEGCASTDLQIFEVKSFLKIGLWMEDC